MILNLYELAYSFVHFKVMVFQLETLIFLEAEVFKILEIRVHSVILIRIYLLALCFKHIEEFGLVHMAHHIFIN